MNRDEPAAIGRRAKIIAYLAFWLVALFATNPSAGLCSLVWMFPIGLWQVAYPAALRGPGWWQLPTCYAVYVGHAFFYFRSRSRGSTIACLLVLILLLLCNVSGCREMIHTH